MPKRLILAIVVALVFPAKGVGGFQDERINAVASVFAERPVTVRCMEHDETNSPYSINAWGYAKKPLAKQTTEQIDADLCRAVQSLNDATVDPYMRAMGVMVIIHESYHLRRWGLAGSESKVQCQAIRHWRVGARLLGASEDTISALWPWALAAHYEETNIPAFLQPDVFPYRDDACGVPPLEP